MQGKSILLEMIGTWTMMDSQISCTKGEEDFWHLLQHGKAHNPSSLNPFLVIILSVMDMDIK